MSDKEPVSNQAYFIARMQSLDVGDRARLKRCAGKTLSEAKDVLGLFYSLLPHGLPQYQEEVYFLVATLYPLAGEGGKVDLGSSLAQARNASNNKGLDRRMEVLLNADLPQLHFRLRQAIHFLQSCRVNVNWLQLLDDLLHWDHPDRYIQQRWARSYFGS